MDDPAGWTEEIARYFLVAIVFIGAAMSVRKNNHIQVDYFYRLLPAKAGRVMSIFVDLFRCVFLGYASWLCWLLIQRIGSSRMAIIDLPMGWVFSAMLFGFVVMFWRSLLVTWRHWRQGYSALAERNSSARKWARTLTRLSNLVWGRALMTSRSG